VENRTKRHNFRGQSGLCEDLQCSKIAAPAKVKEIVSNQLSLVIEPDSQQKNAWVSKSRSKIKTKIKTKKIKFLIIKIEFLIYKITKCWEENRSMSQKITKIWKFVLKS
jgi:hypothetical protein